MRISKQAQRAAKGLFCSCLVDGVLDAARVRQGVQALIQQRPRGYRAMLSHFQRLVKLEVARRTVRVESVMPLPTALAGQVQSALTSRYGPGLAFTFAQNPALIGGLRVTVGNDVYDGSVRAWLAALEESFRR